jgi:pilus assembly protein CpaB
LVYAAISRSESGGGGGAADFQVVVAKSAIPAGATITAEVVEIRSIPEAYVAVGAFTDLDEVVGQVAKFPLVPNEQLTASKFVATNVGVSEALSYVLEENERGMAIQAEAVIGAGGLVLPGDYVDVYFIPDKLLGADHEGAFLIAENVEVVAVQQTIVVLPPTAPGLQVEGEQQPGDGSQRVRGADAEPEPEAITVTLMLTPEQAANIFCADELGTLRLAVRAFGDDGPNGLPVERCVIAAEEA